MKLLKSNLTVFLNLYAESTSQGLKFFTDLIFWLSCSDLKTAAPKHFASESDKRSKVSWQRLVAKLNIWIKKILFL